MLRMLRSLGVTPDIAYSASLGSNALSLVPWFLPEPADDRGRAGRLAVFVGLWAPTLMLIGHALGVEDRAEVVTSVA